MVRIVWKKEGFALNIRGWTAKDIQALAVFASLTILNYNVELYNAQITKEQLMKSATNNLKDAKQTVSYVMTNYRAHNFYMLRLAFKV